MFKSRNRSVRKKIEIPSSLARHPPKQVTNLHCFGEQVSPPSRPLNTERSESDINSFDRSSSSSLSWGDEYEIEATRKVQDHFDCMQKILQGIQVIPENYDVEEYKLWLQTFPNLSFAGEKFTPPKRLFSGRLNYTEEIIAIDEPVSKGCDISTSKKSDKLKSKIKNAVLEKIFHNVSSRLYPETAVCSSKVAPQRNNLERDFTNALHISPVLLHRNEQHRSSHSVSRSHVLSSKWLRDDSPEFTSLPFLTNEQVAVKNTSTSAKSKDSGYVANKAFIKLKPQARNKTFTLPPINKTAALADNYYRSISATPRNKNKTLSAISMQADPVTGERSRLGYLRENGQYIRTPVKYSRELDKIYKKNL